MFYTLSGWWPRSAECQPVSQRTTINTSAGYKLALIQSLKELLLICHKSVDCESYLLCFSGAASLPMCPRLTIITLCLNTACRVSAQMAYQSCHLDTNQYPCRKQGLVNSHQSNTKCISDASCSAHMFAPLFGAGSGNGKKTWCVAPARCQQAPFQWHVAPFPLSP